MRGRGDGEKELAYTLKHKDPLRKYVRDDYD